MKNKKSMAIAMAAVSTLGAVAPAFANEVQTRALNAANIDVMLASGYELVENTKTSTEVFKRTDIYNTNGTTARKDDTLKSAYKNSKIFLSVEQKEEKNSYDDEFVLVNKLDNTKENLDKINEAKANIETAKTLIAEAKSKDATVEVKNVAAQIKDGKFEPSKVTVTVTSKDKKETVDYVFVGAEGIVSDEKPEAAVTAEDLYTDIFKELKLTNKVTEKDETEDSKTVKVRSLNIDLAKAVIDKDKDNEAAIATKNETVAKNHADANLIKYAIESNIEKFDIVKEESGDKNADLDVTLFVKGSDQTKLANQVITIKFTKVAEVDTKSIINMPKLENSDFKNHWAKESILSAMYAGHVDATEKFNPQTNITRAQFAKIACTVFGIKYKEDMIEPFSDVTKADGWKYEYITALYNKKVDGVSVMQGDGEIFRPNAPISRQEVAVVVAKLTKDKLKNGQSPVEFKDSIKLDEKETVIIGYDEDKKPIEKTQEIDVLTKFVDDKEIHAWADNSVKFLNEYVEYQGENGKKPVAEGSSNKFNPKSAITRAEALVMVQRAAKATAVAGTTKQ